MVNSAPGPYILLPRNGIHGAVDAIDSVLGASYRRRVRSIDSPLRLEMSGRMLRAQFDLPVSFGEPAAEPVLVLDTMQRTDEEEPPGPRLVVLSGLAATMLNSEASPVRALPLIEYDVPGPEEQAASSSATAAAGPTRTVRVTCEDSVTHNPLEGARATAQTTAGNVSDLTNASGWADIAIPAAATLTAIVVKPPPGYWGRYVAVPGGSTATSFTMPLDEVDLTKDDGVRHYFKSAGFSTAAFDPGMGVKVGVIDSGVYAHSDLTIAQARNTVTGEPSTATDDISGHGTHVAGLIGANGTLKGMAPGAPLYSYRVFKQATAKATNYAVLKAIIFAEQDGIDILNISLGNSGYDDIVREAIEDARNNGMLVTAAAGNGGKSSIYYPGAYPGALPVAAIGRRKTYPAASTEELDELASPTSPDADEFMARFSNHGDGSLVAAPGVGAVSTLPHDKYGPKSGTSMAAPVIAGIAAGLLSRDGNVYAMPRDASRADAIQKLVTDVCAPLGFRPLSGTTEYDGRGMPDPKKL